jgi:hypothetical protein
MCRSCDAKAMEDTLHCSPLPPSPPPSPSCGAVLGCGADGAAEVTVTSDGMEERVMQLTLSGWVMGWRGEEELLGRLTVERDGAMHTAVSA